MSPIRLSKSVVGKAEADAVSRVICSDGYLGMGRSVQVFEDELKSYFGNKHVICVNSGTAAVHLAVLAAGVKPNDEVLVQSLTFVATFQAISAANAVPVACEILPGTCTIDLHDAEKRLTKKTKAIMPVHYAGRVGDLDAVYSFARKHGLRVIEDAAHAFGTTYKGRKVGSSSEIACFSFDGIKNITSGEGGAVVTTDDEVARLVKDARLLGVERDTEKRYSGQRSWEFEVSRQGYRYHMSNLFAALGSVQLQRFESEFKPKRQRLALRYHERLANANDIILFPNDYRETVPHIFPIRVQNKKRDVLRQYLLEQGIENGVHYYPNHLLNFFGAHAGALPMTERIYGELMSLPLHPDLTDAEQEKVINHTLEFLGERAK